MKKYTTPITASLEDYLEAIYFLNQTNDGVRVTDIAFELGFSKPSVNRAINILKEQGLVVHEHYGMLMLTEKGLEIAENVAQRHYLLKKFLKDIIGVTEKIAEADACLIEHYLSDETIEKISEYMKKISLKQQ